MNVVAKLPPKDHNQPTLSTALSEDTVELRGETEELAARANSGPRKIKTEADLDTVGTLVKDARALAKRADSMRVSIKEPYLTAGREVDQFFKTNFAERLTRIGDTFQKIADDYVREQEAKRRAEQEVIARKAREEEAARLEAARKAEEAGRIKTASGHEAKAETAAAKAEEAEAVAAAPVADLVRTQTDSGLTVSAKAPWVFEIEDYDALDLNKLKPFFKRDDVQKAGNFAVRQSLRKMDGARIYQDTKATFR